MRLQSAYLMVFATVLCWGSEGVRQKRTIGLIFRGLVDYANQLQRQQQERIRSTTPAYPTYPGTNNHVSLTTSHPYQAYQAIVTPAPIQATPKPPQPQIFIIPINQGEKPPKLQPQIQKGVTEIHIHPKLLQDLREVYKRTGGNITELRKVLLENDSYQKLLQQQLKNKDKRVSLEDIELGNDADRPERTTPGNRPQIETEVAQELTIPSSKAPPKFIIRVLPEDIQVPAKKVPKEPVKPTKIPKGYTLGLTIPTTGTRIILVPQGQKLPTDAEVVSGGNKPQPQPQPRPPPGPLHYLVDQGQRLHLNEGVLPVHGHPTENTYPGIPAPPSYPVNVAPTPYHTYHDVVGHQPPPPPTQALSYATPQHQEPVPQQYQQYIPHQVQQYIPGYTLQHATDHAQPAQLQAPYQDYSSGLSPPQAHYTQLSQQYQQYENLVQGSPRAQQRCFGNSTTC